MTQWLSERWACAPTNDGRNYAQAHRWAVVEARPLCFGVRERNHHVMGMPCSDCDAHTYTSCHYARLELRDWANDDARTSALARSYIREAHELRHRIRVMEWLLKSRHVMGEAFDRMRHRKMQILLERISTLEAENAALRQNQPRCPDCGHRLDTEERGCGGGE